MVEVHHVSTTLTIAINTAKPCRAACDSIDTFDGFNYHRLFSFFGCRISDLLCILRRPVICHVFVMCFRRLYFIIHVLSLDLKQINR